MISDINWETRDRLGGEHARFPMLRPVGVDTSVWRYIMPAKPHYCIEEDLLFSFMLTTKSHKCFVKGRVPRGYHTDLASVPRMLWSVIRPDDTRIMIASLIHDLLYEGQYFPRLVCDNVWRAYALAFHNLGYWAIRLGGYLVYQEKQDVFRHENPNLISIERL